MSDETAGTPQTLLAHDGELSDVRTLLGALHVPFVERLGSLRPEDALAAWRLVVGTPRRLLEAPLDPERFPQIAICDRDSHTLRSSLRRAGIRTLVRRPVHPAALRGLLLHALYRGPEKRRSPRISIGAPVTIRAGWRQHSAVLSDLSLGGCRVICEHVPAPGKTFTLCVPASIGGGEAFRVKARVLRRVDGDGPPSFSARFEGVRVREAKHLKRTLQAHASGPARIDAAQAAAPAPTQADSDAGGVAPGAAPLHAAPAASGERRGYARRDLNRRVVALSEEATRVLVGRDISVGGMRVNPNPRLSVGDDIRLAMHVEQLSVPLVVTAKVHRDDGERGLVLRFHHLEPEAARALDAMLDTLPVIDPSASDPGTGQVVTEILSG
jgi:hypothetical protein